MLKLLEFVINRHAVVEICFSKSKILWFHHWIILEEKKEPED